MTSGPRKTIKDITIIQIEKDLRRLDSLRLLKIKKLVDKMITEKFKK